ncbi:MAG: helix-turn-helix transcriptional regulator, partial [Bacteroidales bacterium]|nr:helix-turn-helix transcriptional regulator [Bacteroidales bacterium]
MLKLPKEIMQDLVIKVKKLRKQQGFSQMVLAERSGVSLGSIKRFEVTGKISLEALLQISLALNRIDDFENLFKADDTPKSI